MINWVKKVLAVVVVAFVMLAICGTAYAEGTQVQNIIETTISDDYQVSVINLTAEEVNIKVELVFLNEEDILYTKELDIYLVAHETKTYDAREIYNGSRTTKVEVRGVYESNSLKKAYANLKIGGICIVFGFVIFIIIRIVDPRLNELWDIIATIAIALIIVGVVFGVRGLSFYPGC